MPAGLPELTVNVRHYFLVHSVWGHPWQTGTESSPVPWYSGMSAEEVIGLLHSDAAVIWAKAGIRLVNAGCEPVFDDFWYRWETLTGNLAFSQILDFSASLYRNGLWRKGRKHCSVFWTKGLGIYKLGVACFGAYRIIPGTGGSGSRELRWTEPVVAIMSSGTDGIWGNQNGNVSRDAGLALAHEFGHLLGLPHPWESAPLEMAPFSNAVPLMGTFSGDRNVMSYFWDARRALTVPRSGLHPEEILLADTQIHRARLTLFSRTSPFMSNQRYTGVRLNPDFSDTPNEAFARNGYDEVSDLPDWLSEVHAAWTS